MGRSLRLAAWGLPVLATVLLGAGHAWIAGWRQSRWGSGTPRVAPRVRAAPPRVEPRSSFRRPKVLKESEDSQDRLPSPKTWRELRRDPRFDHSPGNAWRTQLLPEEESQEPKRIQANLVKSKSMQRVLHIIDAGELEKWNPVNLATAWHRLAKFSRNVTFGEQTERDLHVREVQRRLTYAVKDLGPEAFDGRGISSLFYAWGIMRFKSKLLKPFCISARKRLKEFDTQSIANMVFGIGLLGLKGEERILDAVGRHVPKRLKEFSPEEVTSMVYSLSKLKYSPAGDMLEAIGDFVIERLDDFNTIQITKIVVGACVLDFKKNRLMLVLWNHLARRIKTFSTHQLLLLVRTAAQASVKHEKFTRAATSEVLGRLKELGRDARLTQIMENLKILQKLSGGKSEKRKSQDD